MPNDNGMSISDSLTMKNPKRRSRRACKRSDLDYNLLDSDDQHTSCDLINNRCHINAEINKKSHRKILGESDINRQEYSLLNIENCKETLYVYSNDDKNENILQETQNNWDNSPFKIEDTSTINNIELQKNFEETDLVMNERPNNNN